MFCSFLSVSMLLDCDSVESLRRFTNVQKNKVELPVKSRSDAVLCVFIRYFIFLAVFFDTNIIQIHK